MPNIVLMEKLLKVHCALFTSFKQECDYIYNDIRGLDVNRNDPELRNCGILSSEFIKVALPFSTLYDISALREDTVYINEGRHTTLNIERVVTRRRIAYPLRENINAERDAAREISEQLIADHGERALRASRYGKLPLYEVEENTNIANLAWRTNTNIRFRVKSRTYPPARDLLLRKWKGIDVLCYNNIFECIIFPNVVVPLLKAYGVREGRGIKDISIKSMAFNSKGSIREVSTGVLDSWNDKDIDIYFPEEEWLKGGALQNMIAASRRRPSSWREL